MADLKKIEQAVAAYVTLCDALDSHNWKYERNDGSLTIKCSAQGDDLPMDISIQIDAERMVIQLLSFMPFVVSESKRLDFAIAVCAINSSLVDGCFDYNIANGNLLFRMTNSFMESKMSEEVFSYMLFCSCGTIDNYNDKLLMLAKGVMSVSDFLKDNA